MVVQTSSLAVEDSVTDFFNTLPCLDMTQRL